MTIEEGAVLEMAIKLPSSWPLRVADVECRRKVRLEVQASCAPRETVAHAALLCVHRSASASRGCANGSCP